MCLAVPGKILEVRGDGAARAGVVDFSGVQRSISLAFVPDADVGDYVLVHVGFALSRIDEQVARDTLAALEQSGGIEELTHPERADASSG